MIDLIILGNGMAGMTAALYAKRAGLDFKLVGRDEYDFGQIGEAILVENYSCVENLSGFDLGMKLHDQLANLDVYAEEHIVKKIRRPDNYFEIEYTDGNKDQAIAVIYALGATPRKINCQIDGEVNIHYCALCDGALYRNKNVVVIGGGDSAFTQAEYLSKICMHVQILMCDTNITANKALVERVKKNSSIDICYNFPVNHIKKVGEDSYNLFSDGVRGFFITNGIFVAIGMEPNIEPIDFGHIWNNEGYILAQGDCATPVNGFFAAGDVRVKPVRQSITAAADGATSVYTAADYIKVWKSHYEND